jgi:hypothetical protein
MMIAGLKDLNIITMAENVPGYSLYPCNERGQHMKYTVEELRLHLANAKEICVILSENLARNPKDVGISLCLDSAQEEVQDILRELKLAEREMLPENLDGNRDGFSRVEKFSMAAR